MANVKPTAGPDTGASPSEFIKNIQNKPVIVKLNSGIDYRGTSCTDKPAAIVSHVTRAGKVCVGGLHFKRSARVQVCLSA
jgi:hypothetical protein